MWALLLGLWNAIVGLGEILKIVKQYVPPKTVEDQIREDQQKSREEFEREQQTGRPSE